MEQFNAKGIVNVASSLAEQMYENGNDTRGYRSQNLAILLADRSKCPDIYVMFQESSFLEMIELLREFFESSNSPLFEDLDAKSFDITIAEHTDCDGLPEGFGEIEKIFFTFRSPFAAFLSIRLKDYLS